MNHRAFTLMELMIVIVIIGILSAVGMVMFGGQAEKAKIAVAKQHYTIIKKRVAEVALLCSFENSVKLKKTWNNQTVYDVPCYSGVFNNPEKDFMYFFQGFVSADLANNGFARLSPYNNGGLWQRNGKKTYGYAPDCEQDYRVGMVYAVYPDQKVIEFCTCFKTPCSDNSNRSENTITVK